MTDAAPQAATGLDGAIAGLGVNGTQLLGQLLSFAVVALVAWRWVWRPLVQRLDDRTARIAKGLDDARAASGDRAAAEAERATLLNEARGAANHAIAAAEHEADLRREQLLLKAREEVARIVAEGKAQLAAEREAMLRDVRGDVADLVAAATERIIKERITPDKDGKLIHDAIAGAQR